MGPQFDVSGILKEETIETLTQAQRKVHDGTLMARRSEARKADDAAANSRSYQRLERSLVHSLQRERGPADAPAWEAHSQHRASAHFCCLTPLGAWHLVMAAPGLA